MWYEPLEVSLGKSLPPVDLYCLTASLHQSNVLARIEPQKENDGGLHLFSSKRILGPCTKVSTTS